MERSATIPPKRSLKREILYEVEEEKNPIKYVRYNLCRDCLTTIRYTCSWSETYSQETKSEESSLLSIPLRKHFPFLKQSQRHYHLEILLKSQCQSFSMSQYLRFRKDVSSFTIHSCSIKLNRSMIKICVFFTLLLLPFQPTRWIKKGQRNLSTLF